MSFNEILDNPHIFSLIVALVIALFEWFIPYPYFLRPRLLISTFASLGKKVNKPENSNNQNKLAGIFLPITIITPIMIVIFMFGHVSTDSSFYYLGPFFLLLILESRPYRSLGRKIYKSLSRNDKINITKTTLQRFILRDTSKLSNLGLCKATIELIILRLFNSFYVPLFYYLIFGLEFAIVVKLLILLSQAFNKKLPSNLNFGYYTAKIANIIYIPPVISILIALSITPYKAKKECLINSLNIYSKEWPNISSGLLLAYVAGMLNLKLGGPRIYESIKYRYPQIGGFKEPEPNDIKRSIRLMSWSIIVATLGTVFIKSIIVLILEDNGFL